jgi:hypothetical protein
MTRIVVTGFSPDGTSTVVRDEELRVRPGSQLFPVWGYDDGPVSIPSGIGDGQEFGTHFPPSTGLRVYTSNMTAGGAPSGGNAEAPADLTEAMKRGSLGPGRSAGFHASDTVDVAVIISGEMGLELEDGVVTALRPGDIVIQNGTNHAWHPSPTEGCEIAWVLVGATREPGPPQD